MGFAGEHPFLGRFGTFAFLAAHLFPFGSFRCEPRLPLGFNLVQQQPAGDVPIHPLLPGILTFHLNARRVMQQHHAGGNLVDILAAVTAAPDKGFLDVHFAHTQRSHALEELGFFLKTDGERAHDIEANKRRS